MSNARRVIVGSERFGDLNITDPLLWQPGKPVVFLSGCSWACSGGAQRPVALAREVGAMGHPTIYHSKQDPVSQWAGGPIVLNKSSMERLMPQLIKMQGTCIMALVEYADIAKELQRAGWTVAYDVIDDWRAFQQGGNATWYDEQAEVKSLRQANVITCSAPRLAEIIKQQIGRDAHLIRNAGPGKPFAECERPTDMVVGKRGSIVYVGALWGAWFDWRLFEETASEMRRAHFTMVGDFTDYTKTVKLPNVSYVGPRPYPEAMKYLCHADAAIIPFKDETICASVDPVKWYDHVAARVWTVASGLMTDIVGRPWTLVADKKAKSLTAEIKAVMAEERPSRRDAAEHLKDNSWTVRARQMLDVCEKFEKPQAPAWPPTDGGRGPQDAPARRRETHVGP